jgi:hypothetical protein
MTVMGSGDVIGRNQPSENRRSRVKDPTENGGAARPPRARRQQMCGAMTQQGADNRMPSQPQEFVQLVGYRDPKTKSPARH